MAIVRTIEYVEITLTDENATSANLTKSQAIAACVPILSVRHDTDDINNRRFPEVYFETGPKVTARKDSTSGTTVVGVFVIEFDTSGSISVQQDTWSITDTTTTVAIDAITTTKAFTVINYRHSDTADDWEDGVVSVVFNSTTELGMARVAPAGTVNGRSYVVATSGTDFSVQHIQVAFGQFSEIEEDAITALTLASSFIIHSINSTCTNSEPKQACIVVDLKDTTTIRARRAFDDFIDDTADAVTNFVTTVEAQIIKAGGSEFTVERAESRFSDSTTKANTVTEIDQARAVVVPGGYNGAMSNSDNIGGDMDGHYAIMDFTSDTEVTGTRTTNTTINGTTMFEVVEFELAVVLAAEANAIMAPYIPV
jgi:hypothetical protein